MYGLYWQPKWRLVNDIADENLPLAASVIVVEEDANNFISDILALQPLATNFDLSIWIGLAE